MRKIKGNEKGAVLILVFWLIAIATVFASSLMSIAMTKNTQVKQFMAVEQTIKLLQVGANEFFYAVDHNDVIPLPELNQPKVLADVGSYAFIDYSLTYFGTEVTVRALVNNISRVASFTKPPAVTPHPIIAPEIMLYNSDPEAGEEVVLYDIERGLQCKQSEIKDIKYSGKEVFLPDGIYPFGFAKIENYKEYTYALVEAIQNNEDPDSFYAEKITLIAGRDGKATFDLTEAFAKGNKHTFIVLESQASEISIVGSDDSPNKSLILAIVTGNENSKVNVKTVPTKKTMGGGGLGSKSLKEYTFGIATDGEMYIPADANFQNPENSIFVANGLITMDKVPIDVDAAATAMQTSIYSNTGVKIGIAPSNYGFFLRKDDSQSAFNVDTEVPTSGGSGPGIGDFAYDPNIYKEEPKDKVN